MNEKVDNLRPEVREAVAAVSRWMGNDKDWATIRAELVRLAECESELAALKRRVAEAPVVECPPDKPTTEDGWLQVIEWAKGVNWTKGKRVRLLLGDGEGA